MGEFKVRLGVMPEANEPIVRAFAAVASDLRPRGAAVFEFLEETLTTDPESERREAAATALSSTNLPEAAEALANHYPRAEVRDPLVRMGDLAVPALTALVEKGPVEVLDDLQAIGTPQAATSLVPLLWAEDETLAQRAACRLAAMLPGSNVEAVLRDYKFTEDQRKAEWLDWIWQPFAEGDHSALPVIAGRIAYLMNQGLPDETALEMSSELDPRLVIPLYSVTTKHERDSRHRLLNSLTPRIRSDLQSRVRNTSQPTPNDWRNIFQPVEYEFETGWHRRVVIIITALISLIALGQMGVTVWNSSALFSLYNAGILAWYNTGKLVATIMALVLSWGIGLFVLLNKKPKREGLLLFLLGPIFSIPHSLYNKYEREGGFNFEDGIHAIFFSLLTYNWVPIVGYFTTIALLNIFSWQFTLFIQLT